jgi:hypothetical protein
LSENSKSPALPWYQRRNTIRYRGMRYLSKITNGRIPTPYFYSVKQFHKESDEIDLEKERVSADEHVRTWSLWTVEFYTPNNINGLYAALDRIQSAELHNLDRNPSEWLRRNRMAAGSTMELYLSAKGTPGLATGHYCSLPEFADHAAGTIICVTPSLTLLVMHFELKASESCWLDEQLHNDRTTRIVQNPRGSISISSPRIEQRRLVHEKRESWLLEATSWHRSNFPGLLSTNNELVPMCELSILTGAVPFDENARNSNLMSALGLDWSYGVFEGPTSVETKLFKFSHALDHCDSFEFRILSATENNFRSQNVDYFGTGDRAYLARLDQDFRRAFAMASLPRALTFYAQHTASARDNAAAIVGSKNASKALARVRADTAQCVDAAMIARELSEAAERDSLDIQDTDFTLRIEREGRTEITLSNAVKDQIKEQAKDLAANVESLNANLNAQASLLSAHAALKLQPIIIALTVVSAIAGLVAAVGPAKEMLYSNVAESKQHASK